jgi:hypothetical protein
MNESRSFISTLTKDIAKLEELPKKRETIQPSTKKYGVRVRVGIGVIEFEPVCESCSYVVWNGVAFAGLRACAAFRCAA